HPRQLAIGQRGEQVNQAPRSPWNSPHLHCVGATIVEPAAPSSCIFFAPLNHHAITKRSRSRSTALPPSSRVLIIFITNSTRISYAQHHHHPHRITFACHPTCIKKTTNAKPNSRFAHPILETPKPESSSNRWCGGRGFGHWSWCSSFRWRRSCGR
ncbi:hypothetical protein V8G54_035086, partial [Vigna mungo]